MNAAVRAKLAVLANEAEQVDEEHKADQWTARALQFVQTAVGGEQAAHFARLDSGNWWPGTLNLRRGYLEGLIALADESIPEQSSSLPEPAALSPRSKSSDSRKVFVVHGHDEAAKNAVALFLERVGLNPIILHEQASGGRTIIEKVEAYSGDVAFAVVLLTPDDVGSTAKDSAHLNPRARQNVILELGFFLGKLGRTRVCALHKGGVELPSDFHGVVYVPMDDAGAWKNKLAQEIVESKITIKIEGLLTA